MPFDASVDGMTEGVFVGISAIPLAPRRRAERVHSLASLSEGGALKGRKESPYYSLLLGEVSGEERARRRGCRPRSLVFRGPSPYFSLLLGEVSCHSTQASMA